MMDLSPLVQNMRQELAATERALAQPDAFADRQAAEQLTRDHQRLSSFLQLYDNLEEQRRQLAENHQLLTEEDDPELVALVQADIEQLDTKIARLETKVMSEILPPEPHDSRNTIVEFRPATGGDEAALFAADLRRMYLRYAETRGWRAEHLRTTETDLGGVRDAAVSIQGDNVYRTLKLESGVHRVQRIPTTETSGRIHTSTVTVAVLPEARDVDVEIKPDKLEIDVFRASGAGGQHVNTTDSAVRITHLPTGVVVTSQQERSQHRNREIALRVLRSRLLEARQQEEQAKYDARRKAQVGTGERSERIRTYNFPQNRVTDHRYGLSWYNLPAMLEGDLEEMFEQLIAAHNAQRLENELAQVG